MNFLNFHRKGNTVHSAENNSFSGTSETTLSSTGISAHHGPGAVSVGRGETLYRVRVPDNIQPGEEFQVYADGRILRVKGPLHATPGTLIQFTVPVNYHNNNYNVNSTGNLALQNSPNIRVISGRTPPEYEVTVPGNIRRGQTFPVNIQGQRLMVICPNNSQPGMNIRFVLPLAQNMNNPPSQQGILQHYKPAQKPSYQTKMFEVLVPNGVQPGQSFALLAEGRRFLVTCPLNASSGQKIRFRVPIGIFSDPNNPTESNLAKSKLTYDDKDGWMRIIRVTDMKFQWIRMDNKGDIDLNKRFHSDRAAYVRQLEFVSQGYDSRMRGGRISLIPASEAVVVSNIKGVDGRELVTCSDIVQAQNKTFEKKIEWFKQTCDHLRVKSDYDHLEINVRRDYLLSDSMEAVMCLSPSDLRKPWRFKFLGEDGLDAGGLAREWFKLVTTEIFNPGFGLWKSSTSNQMCMQINTASKMSCPEDYLNSFRFTGRVLGKALFDQQLVTGHMVQYLYKHLLGWPISFADLEEEDDEYYRSLQYLLSMDDVEMMCVNFTVTEEILGVKQNNIDLIPNGSQIDLNNDNLPEYLEACLKYRMLGRVEQQLKELLLGFYDIIPEPILTIFDYHELELLMCGLPDIDIDDWIDNTEYSGAFEHFGLAHEVCIWFWEVVDTFDQEMKARLLQFVTGTSGVPSLGFGILQGSDGNIRRFTINGVNRDSSFLPEAHTCFNRIDLPVYKSQEDLRERLTMAITIYVTGFQRE